MRAAALGAFVVVLVALAPAAGSASRQHGAPRNMRVPKISGTKLVGRTLFAHRGTWARRPRHYRFTWQRCTPRRKCAAVRGATRTVYRLGKKDLGWRIRVVVKATNAAGSTSAASGLTRAIQAPSSPPPPPGPPPPPPPPPPAPPPGRVVMTEDLGWAPVPPASLPWNVINQLILFNLATQNGPGLDKDNISEIDVPAWVATVHAHPGIAAIIAIGGAGNDHWGQACNDTNRAQFIQNLVGFATSNHFDGLDLDIEDGPWSNQGPPVPAMTKCIQEISAAAHAAGLRLSADVITNWQGPWYAPSQASVDQFNLMTFGSDLPTMKSDVQDTIDQGLPASKFVVGVDVSEHPQPAGGCAQFSSYAAQAGLLGSFVWEAHADYTRGNICVNGLAAG